MKKIFKYTTIFICIIFTILTIIPFLFKDKIKDNVISIINDNLNAKVNFKGIDFSILRNFPHASISITDISVVNKAPFEGDTLVYAGRIDAKMSIKEIFKSSDKPMNIEGFSIKKALINIIFDENGLSNYDIALKNEKKSDISEKPEDKSNLKLSIQKYELENVRISYTDKSSKTKLVLDKINHKGTGDFTNNILDLHTHTSAFTSLDINGVNYMKSVNFLLDAVLNLDLENYKFSFKENIAHINNLPLKFDGFMQLNGEEQEYDINFNTTSSSFANALGLIPSAYSGNMKNINTSGEFSLKGWVKGILSDNKIPQFNIEMLSNKASVKYPNLPKSIQNISIDAKIINSTGEIKDTYLNLDKLSFKIDNDVFKIKAKAKDLTENILINANIDGIMNLANLSNAYPISLDQKLTGTIRINTELNMDMKSIEQKKYENIKAKGLLNLSNFTYETEELSKPLEISVMNLKFNPSHVDLDKFRADIGDSDLELHGILDNFYGFLFKKQVLKGEFDLKSNNIRISDLLTENSESNQEKTNNTDEIKAEKKANIPDFLDCTININAKKVIYDNLNLENVSGKLTIKDKTLDIENLKTDIFEGNIKVNGNVSTKPQKPTFNVNLDLKRIDIYQSFTQLKMLGKIAPIAGTVAGKISSKIKVSGNLHDEDLTPDLSSISGNLFGELSDTKVDKSKSKLLSNLDNNLDFIDLDKLNLDELKADLSFENGKVYIKPMDINYQDINIKLSGSHGFDEIINYNTTLNVPAKYFGRDIEKLFAIADENEINKTIIPISAKITGNFSSPIIQTDINKVLENLYKQLINKKKNDFLENIIEKNKPNESEGKKHENPVNEIKDLAKDALNNIFSRKK